MLVNMKSALLCATFIAGISSFSLAATGTVSRAAAMKDPKQYTLNEKSVKVEVQEYTPDMDIKLPSDSGMKWVPDQIKNSPVRSDAKGNLGDNLVILDQIVNLTTKIWGIIKENQPVVNVTNQYATAVPQGVASWTKLTGWKGPKGYIYTFSVENLYGVKTVSVKYMITYTYNGSYQGTGRYLTAVTVEPLSVDVLWGYTYEMSAEVPDSSIVNAGTETDPVAAMQLVLKWKISTVLKSSQGRSVNYIRGDGYIQEMGNWDKSYSKDVKTLTTMEDVKGKVSVPEPVAK